MANIANIEGRMDLNISKFTYYIKHDLKKLSTTSEIMTTLQMKTTSQMETIKTNPKGKKISK